MRIQIYFLVLLGLLGACNSVEQKKSSPVRANANKLFNLLSEKESGISFKNQVVETDSNNYFTNQYIYNGGGVAVGDLNNDGLDDIYFSGNEVDDQLYLNQGDLKFENHTLSAGIQVGDKSWSTGVVFVDINADGWLDIYVCKAGFNQDPQNRKNQLYINKRDGTFLLDERSALSDSGCSTQASFFDFDLDGDLDVYVMNYPEIFEQENITGNPPMKDSDHLYLNQGGGNFQDITAQCGLQNYAFGLGLITADFNGDHFPDIYVANDYLENDFLYINQRNGKFTDEIKNRTGHNSQSSMGADRADINNDGFEDLFVAEMLPSDYKRSKENMASMDIESFWYFINQGHHYQYMHNVLQLNNHNGYFSDISQLAGVDKTDWSWSPILEDFDNDGNIDLFVTNGVKRDMLNKDAKNRRKLLQKQSPNLSVEELYASIPSTKLSNYVFKSNSALSFENMTKTWGLDQLTFSNGATTADLDNDGDLDLIINNLEERAFIYKNNSEQEPSAAYVQVELTWPKSPNVDALNSKVELFTQGAILSREVLPSAGFQSGRSNTLHFGLKASAHIDSARVIWPNGAAQTIQMPSLNKKYEVRYNPNYNALAHTDQKYFKEIDPKTLGLEFQHEENTYDDFKNEILLPHKQSMLGPGLEVGDINGDGLDDIFIGGASGQHSRLFIQGSGGLFSAEALSDTKELENLAAAIFDSDNDGDGDLYLANGGNESGIEKKDTYFINQGKSGLIENPRGRTARLEWPNSSCTVTADFNGDGYLDLFVGGGSKPGQYPLSDSSYLLINDKGRLIDASNQWLKELNNLGFITSAITTDFNQDGKQDLVTAGEWQPVTFYKNTGDSFLNVTEELGLEEEIGWWYSLAAADINQDGIEDIIAGNIGANHKFRPSAQNPFRIYYDDYDQNGTGDIVLANTLDNGTTLPVRGKQCMSEQMPFISKDKVESYGEFANSELNELLGKNPENSQVSLAATQFSSSIFYSSKNNTFTRSSLPAQAQIGPINGIQVLDVNNDGHLDIIAAGNKFNTEVETTRADAGVGTVLLSGRTPAINSGFFTPGNVKGIQLLRTPKATYVIVANNNSKIQIFKVLD